MTYACLLCAEQFGARPLRCKCGGVEFVAIEVTAQHGAVRVNVGVVERPRKKKR